MYMSLKRRVYVCVGGNLCAHPLNRCTFTPTNNFCRPETRTRLDYVSNYLTIRPRLPLTAPASLTESTMGKLPNLEMMGKHVSLWSLPPSVSACLQYFMKKESEENRGWVSGPEEPYLVINLTHQMGFHTCPKF